MWSRQAWDEFLKNDSANQKHTVVAYSLSKSKMMARASNSRTTSGNSRLDAQIFDLFFNVFPKTYVMISMFSRSHPRTFGFVIIAIVEFVFLEFVFLGKAYFATIANQLRCERFKIHDYDPIASERVVDCSSDYHWCVCWFQRVCL
jgi:hypothetical protein